MATKKSVKKRKTAKKKITKTVQELGRERLAKQGRVLDEAFGPTDSFDTKSNPGKMILKSKTRRMTMADRKPRSG